MALRTFVLLLLACGLPGQPRASASCFEPAVNASFCPGTWTEARTWCTEQRACTGDGGCRYPGLGDVRSDGECPSDAVIGCFQTVWRCGQ